MFRQSKVLFSLVSIILSFGDSKKGTCQKRCGCQSKSQFSEVTVTRTTKTKPKTTTKHENGYRKRTVKFLRQEKIVFHQVFGD